MKKFQITAILCGLFLTGLANAECASTLNKEELIKCQKEEAKGAKENMAKSSTVSPITGKDVTKTAPAAGTAATKKTK